MRSTFIPVMALLATLSGNAVADAHEAPAGSAVLEAYVCNYNQGKDRDDVDAATRFYLKQAEKVGYATPDAFLWTLNKGSAPFELAWFNVHADLTAYGEADDAWAASAELREAGERYDAAVTCQGNLGNATSIYQSGTGGPEGGRAVIASYACNFRDGSGPQALADLGSHIAAYNAGLGDLALTSVIQVVPVTGDNMSPDVFMWAIADDTAGWARHIDTLTSNPAGRAVAAHFNAVLDCGTSLWYGEQVVGGE